MDKILPYLFRKPSALLFFAFLLFAMDGSAQVSISCPANITVANNIGDCGAIVTYTTPVGTGSGTNVVTELNSGLASGSFFSVGTHTITYKVGNDEGDLDNCSFDITVNDTEDPVFDCPEDITATAPLGTCEVVVTFPPPSATDNCGIVSVIQIGGPPSGSSFPVGETNIDHETLDAAGNAAFCRFKIIVEDITGPTISCPSDITVSAGPNCDAVVNYTPPVGVDLCTISNTTLTSGIGAGGTFPLGTSVETYTVVDIAGNSATCSFNVIVEDQTPPVITCPASLVLTTSQGQCDMVVNFANATATDNCTATTITQIDGQTSGSTFDLGLHTIEFEATDAAGNSSQCTFTIDVSENTAPSIDCPGDINVSNDPGVCGAVVTYPLPTGSDICSSTSVALTSGLGSGATFPIGASTEVYTVTDDYGNQSTCSFEIVVEDNEAPVVICPADMQVFMPSGDCITVVNYTMPTFTDNCPGATMLQTEGPANGAIFVVGLKTMEFEITDAAGNLTICTFTIDVIDNVAPSITCPADQVINIPGGNCSTTVTYADPVISDNCPGSTFTLINGPSSGDVVNAGIHTVEFEASDLSGNTSTCSFQLTVTETSNPVFVCPSDLTVSTDLGMCDAVVSFGMPLATDSCSNVVVTQTSGPVSGSTFPLGSTTIEFEAEDEFGNTASCSYNVIVEDDEIPEIDCPSDLTVGTDLGDCGAIVNFTPPTFSDNCVGSSIIQTLGPASGSFFDTGSTAVSFTATDAAGNTSDCTYNIIVEDDENPVIACPSDFSFDIPGGFCEGTITYPDPTITDNCVGSTFSVLSGPASGDNVGPGSYTVVLQATDAAGNTETCSFDIEVTENSSPEITCPADIEVPADAGTCEAIVTFTAPSATDSCSIVTVTQTAGPASGSTFPAGATTLSFEAEDEYGNTATCSYIITVVDDTDPEITCPSDIVIENDLGLCSAVVNYAAPVVNDNCGIGTTVQTAGIGSGNIFPVGVTTETYEVTDISGNTTTCSFTVTVEDNEAPEITCPADISEDIMDGTCELIVNYTLPTATDNCSIDQINLISGLASGESFPAGNNTVTFEAVDINGNTATCSFTVTVNENTIPEIACPADVIISNGDNLCGAIVNYDVPVGTDNCNNATTTLTAGLGTGSLFPVGITTETYTVTDANGNMASCSFTVTVTDDEAPVLDCGTDITVSNDAGVCEAIVNYQTPTVTDNCATGLVPVLVSGPVSGSTFPLGTTTLTFEANDGNGNIATCSFDVIVEDTELPSITCPADIAIVATSGDCEAEVIYSAPVSSDNCNTPTVSLVSGLASGEDFPVGVTIVTYEAVDDAGNAATCSFTVTVTEDVLPTISCPGDITADNDLAECGAIVDFTAPVGTDNCGGATTALISGLAPGSLFPVGITTVTYQVTDLSGNQASCSFTVTVEDTEAPLFDCPADQMLSVDANCEAVYTFTVPTATDNCSAGLVVTQIEGPASGTLLPIGITTFTFTTTDDESNIGTCSYTVNVEDNDAPTFISCPADITLIVDPSMCDAFLSYTEPTATDNCQVNITQVSGPANNSDLAVGTYNVSYTATDDAGNISLCDFTVSVSDTISPVISCPVDFETCETAPTFNLPTATDNCSISTITQTSGPTSGGTFATGDNIITFEATDVNGNTSSCSFTIHVNEGAAVADAGLNRNICGDLQTTLDGSDPGTGNALWALISGSGNIVSPNSQSTDVTELGFGVNQFTYTIDPNNGCPISQDTISVIVETGVYADAGEDASIENGGSELINASVGPPGGDVNWMPPIGLSCTTCINPVASPTETTTYYLEYTTALGCSKTDSVTISVFDSEVFPNTITPDGDGVNDVWNIPGIQNYPGAYVVIYNRWGNEIFQSTGYNEPWNGQRDGDDLPAGSYYYIIDYKVSGKETLNGTVNIIR